MSRAPGLCLLPFLLLSTACENCDPSMAGEDAGLDDRDAGSGGDDAGRSDDAGVTGADAGTDAGDAGLDPDAGPTDPDAGATPSDAGLHADAGVTDNDAGLSGDGGVIEHDAGVSGDAGGMGGDSGVDAGAPDAGGGDGGGPGHTDAGGGSGPCISGATGTHALRFEWTGSTSGSTAWVIHELNTLPDTSRWRVTAASSSIGYTPVFRDPFLGEGGLELSGTVFIDVELSTLGLGNLSAATIAVYGRSYNTTASGSFTWQTFSGTGASPSGGVSNSAPYEWYAADATAALPAGDDGTLLRLRAGPPSSALIVRRVEVCFDAS